MAWRKVADPFPAPLREFREQIREGDGDGGQADDGHRAGGPGQAVNRHGVALR